MSRPGNRGFWPLRDMPVLVRLAATATATVAVAFVHPFVPTPRWLMIHLLVLGAVSHAILVWSRYFTDAPCTPRTMTAADRTDDSCCSTAA